MISICYDIITEEIITKINNAMCFTLIVHKTMETSGTEEKALCDEIMVTYHSLTDV